MSHGEVKSLFDLCLGFVAVNAHYIDSLDGFPEDFGSKIFERALQLGNLDVDTQDAQYTLRLYGEAGYWREVKIPSLLLLNEYDIAIIHMVKFTVFLDLSNITLDDNHDILTAIPELENVQVLILENTNLTDKGIKKIIYPAFNKQKIPSLRYLDLSGLELTPKLLNNLRHVTQLETVLFFSGQVEEKILQFRQSSRPDIQAVKNSSLLTKLLIHWSRNLSRRKVAENKPRSGFYTTKLSQNTSDPSIKIKVKRNKIMFKRVYQECSSKQDTKVSTWFSNQKKRKSEHEVNEVCRTKIARREDVKPENSKMLTNIQNILDQYR